MGSFDRGSLAQSIFLLPTETSGHKWDDVRSFKPSVGLESRVGVLEKLKYHSRLITSLL